MNMEDKNQPEDQEDVLEESKPLHDYWVEGVSIDYKESEKLRERLNEIRRKHGLDPM